MSIQNTLGELLAYFSGFTPPVCHILSPIDDDEYKKPTFSMDEAVVIISRQLDQRPDIQFLGDALNCGKKSTKKLLVFLVKPHSWTSIFKKR